MIFLQCDADWVKKVFLWLCAAIARDTKISIFSTITCPGTGSLSRGVYPVSMMETAFRGFNTHPRNLQPVVKFYSLFGEYINRYYGNIFYGKGQNLAIQLTKAYDAALEKYDVLIMPTLTHVATKIPPANCSTEGKKNNQYNRKCIHSK